MVNDKIFHEYWVDLEIIYDFTVSKCIQGAVVDTLQLLIIQGQFFFPLYIPQKHPKCKVLCNIL
jgi:hypothetical protein